MIKSYGAEFVGLSKVAGGTTDFQQYILAAEDAGADGVMLPLGENEAVQVLRAAQQLGTKLGLLGEPRHVRYRRRGVVRQVRQADHFNAEMPPITGDHGDVADPADGDQGPRRPRARRSSRRTRSRAARSRSWVAVYHFKTIMEKFGDARQHHAGSP